MGSGGSVEEMRNAYSPIRWAVAATTGFGVGFVSVGTRGWGPPAANEQAIGEVSRWCERVDGGLLREPINTLGNLAFVIAGLTIFAVLAKDSAEQRSPHNQFIGNTPIALLYASATLFLGPGSMVMHGAHTRFGAWIDNVSMVAYILIPWMFNLSRLGEWRERTLFGAYAATLSAYAVGYWFIGPDLGIGLDLFGLSIALWLISELVYRVDHPLVRPLSGLGGFVVAAVFGITPSEMLAAPGEYWWVVFFWLPAVAVRGRSAVGRRRYTPWFWAGIASFLAAYAIWLTGTPDHPWCRPDSLLQAHAVWHILCAAATLCFFLFLRTERAAPIRVSPETEETARSA